MDAAIGQEREFDQTLPAADANPPAFRLREPLGRLRPGGIRLAP